MSWKDKDKLLAQYTGGSGSGKFINLKDGDKFKGVFLGDSLARVVVWNGQRTVPFDQNEHLEKDGKLKVAHNVYDLETKTIRIFEMNSTTFVELAKIHTANDNKIDDLIISVARRGSGKETVYWVAKDDTLDPADVERLGKVFDEDGYNLIQEFDQAPGVAMGPNGPSTQGTSNGDNAGRVITPSQAGSSKLF